MSGRIEKLGMPKWGLSMTEGRLVGWLVDEGAEISPGDEVAEVETDKLSGGVEVAVGGVLRRRVAAVGDVVPVGGLLGVIADPDVPDADVDAFVAEFQAAFVPGADEEAGPASETVTVDAGTLHFLRQGEGEEPVVLLHGFGGDLENWMFAAPALAAERTVYGAGDPDALASAVGQFLAAQQIERADLVGHSLGGLVAATLALSDPARVRTLTLVASAGLGPEINREYIEGFIAAKSRRELKPVLELLFADPGQVTRRLVDDVLKYKRIDGVDEALRAIAGQVFGPEGQRVLIADRLPALDVPILAVWGAGDRIIPAAHAENLPEAADVHVLDGAGHSPHMEAAGEVNRLLERFLAGARAGA